MIGAPVGIDDQIRGNVRPGGLREDMYARRRTSPAHRVADDPAHGVTGRDRHGAYKLLAFLKRDVGHLTGSGIDMIARSIGPSLWLERVHIDVSSRHQAGGRLACPAPGAQTAPPRRR